MIAVADQERPDRRRLVRTLILVAIGLGLCWLSVVVGLANAASASSAATILRIAPWDARTLATRAKQISEADPSVNGLAKAERYALAAVQRDPTLVSSLAIIGFSADAQGRHEQAARLFRASERLSRRDLQTQLWLIEKAVARNDIGGALRHYDIALRTSALAPVILHPILIGALGDPNLVRPLAGVLGKKPNWRFRFLTEAVGSSAPTGALVTLGRELRRAGAPLEPEIERLLELRLLNEKRFEALAEMYRARGGVMAGRRLNDPSFTETRDLFPFGWVFAETADLSAQREPGPAGGGLAFEARAGAAGEVARQVLMLPVGRYRLSWTATLAGGSEAQPRWALYCLEGSNRELVRPIPSGSGATRSVSFAVPAADCAAQAVTLSIPVNDAPVGVSGRIEHVEIQPQA